MALFSWSDDYSVKVPSIDAQHHRLVDMLNELHDGMVAGKASEHVASVLDGLIAYTAQHFSYEEELFAKYAYPEAAEHIAEHQKLVEQVVAFKTKLLAKEATITMELVKFLKNWLIGHILGSDKKYSALLVEQRVE